MKIAFNPSTVAALITPPNNKDITFDLRGRNIFARGVKFCGTDTWRDIKINNVSIGSNILDLRNGSNTTLTNTNGVVTINSTWRPVVDNLTSDSTTSSLSANLGRILKVLIDGKSDLGHTHDDRYLKLTGGTMTGNIILSRNATITKLLSSTSHYSSVVRWSVDGETKKYGREIGLHNLGGSDSTGSIAIVPYKTDTDPWSGTVGLFIAKNVLKLDNKPIAFKSDIPSSLKNPYSLTLLANGTTLATYDGSVSKIVNLTYDNVGAAAKNHTHNSLEPWASYSYITGDSHATALKSIFDKNKTSIPRNKFISMLSRAYDNTSYYMGYFIRNYDNNPYGGFFVAHYDTAYYIGIANGSFTQHRLVYSTDIPNSLKNPHALTISLNGTSLGPYDGSAAKNINITPGSIGAATSGHNHDNRYLKLTGGTMQLGEGLKFHADDNYFGTNSDARIISLLDGNGKVCDGGLIIDERATLDGKEYVTELLRIRDSEFKWRGSNILHSGNSHINGNTITINGSSLTVSKSDHTHSNYVTDLGTSNNYLTWTKNGSTNNITVPYATTSSYLTNGFSAPFVNKWDCNAPDRVVYSDYGSDGRLITNHPSGWNYGTLLELGHTNHRGLNGLLNILLMWDVAHNTTLPGTLWFRGKDEVNGWAKSWAKVITDLNISSILNNYYTKSEVDTKLNSKLNYRLFWERTNIDLNSITEAWHTYEVNNGTDTANTPTNASWHQAVLWGTGDTNYAVLLCTAYTSNYSLYLRHKIAGKWNNWIQLATTTDIPSSLKNPYSLTTFGVVYDGSAAKVVSPSNFISLLEEVTGIVTDGTMFITSWASDNGFADTNAVNVPYKRKAIRLWDYIKVKTDSLYYTKLEVNNLLSKKLDISNFNWTNLSGKLAGNEFNIVNAGFNNRMWFNYLPINDRSKTATITGYSFGNGAQGYASVLASGFVKTGSSSNYVLLGDGGHQTISSLFVNHALFANYICRGTLPTLANNTVKAYKDSLVEFFKNYPSGIGANVSVSASIISNWSNDAATYFDSSSFSVIKISGSYDGTTYGQFLLSSYNLSQVGIVGRNNSQWSKIKWLAYEDQIPTDNNQLANGAGYITSAGSCAYATSAGNADTVDGYHVTAFNDKPWGYIPAINLHGYMDIGKHLEFHYDNTTGSDYSTILSCTGNYSNNVNLPSASGTLALTSDNVASATKLQTPRTIWGQSFDGTNNINGTFYFTNGDATMKIYDVASTNSSYGNERVAIQTSFDGLDPLTSSYPSTYPYRSALLLLPRGGNIGIGTTSPSYKLHVAGDIYTTTGFKKNGSSDSYVLLGGGGHKLESSLRVAYASNADTVDGYHVDDILPYGLENLCIGAVASGGQTILNSDGSITTSGNNSDTYFYVRSTENLIAGQIYTVGFYVTGVPSGNTAIWAFPFAGQGNNKLVIDIKSNGWCWGTGTIPEDIVAGKDIIFDDRERGFYSSINISKFVIVKGKQKAYYTPPISKMSVNHATSSGNADTVDGQHFSYLNSSNSPTYLWATNSDGSSFLAARASISVNYANSAGNATTATKLTSSAGSATLPIYFLDGKPVACTASSVFSNLSNSGNNLSITVAGQNRTLTVGYATSAGSATKVIVNLNTTNDTNYPLVWSNLSNTNSVTENQLYKSWSDLYYNPKNKRLTVGGSVVASSFIKSGGTSLQLLRADGGIATFNWSGQSGLPTWLWGGNNEHSYYVYNPSNFRVAYATSSGNADTLDGVHLSGIFTAFGNNNHNITATIGGVTKEFLVNWAADSDKLDGYHASNLLTSVTNTNNGISVTVGGTTKSVSNISVNYANSAGSADTALYLRSLGNLNCQTGRTLNYGDVYTYNTYDGNTGSPTTFTSVIGFGRGIAGTVEIAGGWDNTNLYWRSLRDCCEDWHSWRTVLDSSNYTGYINNYYWANVKISTSSSTTTSPTVSNLTATSSIRMGNIYLLNTNEINSTSGIHLNYQNSGNISLCVGGGKVGIGTTLPTYKLDVNGDIHSSGTINCNSLNVDSTLNIKDSVISCSAGNISILSKESGSLLINSREVLRYDSDFIYMNNRIDLLHGLCFRTSTLDTTYSIYTTDDVTVLIGVLRDSSSFKFKPAKDGLLLFLKIGKLYSDTYFWCTAENCVVVRAKDFGIYLDKNQNKDCFGDGLARIFIYTEASNRWYEFYCG